MKIVIPSVPPGLAPALSQWCQGVADALKLLAGQFGPDGQRAVRLSEAEAGVGAGGQPLLASVRVGEGVAARLAVQGLQAGLSHADDEAVFTFGPRTGQLQLGPQESKVAAAGVEDGLYLVTVSPPSGTSWAGLCRVLGGAGAVHGVLVASAAVAVEWQGGNLAIVNPGAQAMTVVWSLARQA